MLEWGNVPEWVSAIGTLVAAWAAIVAARRAGAAARSAAEAVVEARKATTEAKNTTKEAEKSSRAAEASLKLERQRDDERRAAQAAEQANQVSVWFTTKTEPFEVQNSHGDAGVIWDGDGHFTVRNASGQPIHDVALLISSHGQKIGDQPWWRTLSPNDEEVCPVQTNTHPRQLDASLKVPHDFDQLRVCLAFRDGSNRRWFRDEDGVLHRVQAATSHEVIAEMAPAALTEPIMPWDRMY